MIPGVNLLKMAQTVIAKQPFTYYKNAGRTKNAIGNFVQSFEPGVEMWDTVQPIPQAVIRQMGLPMEKNYLIVYTSTDMRTLARGGSSDEIEFDNKRWKALESNDWVAIDGWEGLIFVELPIGN